MKLAFLLDVSKEVMLSYWYDLTPMGVQIKKLSMERRQLSKELLEIREMFGTTQAKLDRLESTLLKRTVSSQGSIEDIQHVSNTNCVLL